MISPMLAKKEKGTTLRANNAFETWDERELMENDVGMVTRGTGPLQALVRQKPI